MPTAGPDPRHGPGPAPSQVFTSEAARYQPAGTRGIAVSGTRELQHRERRGRFAKTAESAERDREACRLRTRGMTYQQISDRLGYGSEGNARRAVQACLAAIQADGAEELRAIQLQQLDYLTEQALNVLESAHHVVTQAGRIVTDADGRPLVDHGPVLAAIDRLLKIQERRAKLMGLDAPIRQEVITLDQIDREIERLIAELARRGEA